jgi:hypothetical protein
MRLAFKVAVMTLVLFGGMNYMAYLYTGKSFFPAWLEKTRARIANFKQDASEALGSVKTAAEDTTGRAIYKWTDADGVQQYTSDPPPEGVRAEIVRLDPNANLIRAVPVPESAPETPAAPADSAPSEQAPAAPDIPFPYTPEQIGKTMEDARNAQKTMNERIEQQQRILENL